jgi:hypothetical protein
MRTRPVDRVGSLDTERPLVAWERAIRRDEMRRIVTRGTAIVAGALALAACGEGDEANEGAQDTVVDGTEDAPTEDSPTEDAPSADGDVEVEVEGPDGTTTDAGAAPSDGDPDWSGPPSDQVGVPIGLQPAVVEGDGAVVSLAGMTVYRDGVDLTLGVHWDPDGEEDTPEAGGATDRPGGPMDAVGTGEPPESEDDLPDDLLRVELVYPDGTTVSSVDHLLATAEGSDPEEPALNPYTGMGDERSWDQSLWSWPLPEGGDNSMELVVDWPAQGIDEERIELDIDADDITDATEQVVDLWD